MRLSRRSAVASPILLLCLFGTGCASTADKNIAYRDSHPAPPLTIPADLDAPVSDQRLEIPGTDTRASASDFDIDVKPPAIIPAQSTP